ncbi:Required for respiratory growth protein 9 mitochondrial [Onygenales sp. PD_40]|nr:Required for respiratory growth protein 9 mitochondrial [Onygenales sp. PD_40]KAK2782170.1 Required for respiratory growth protein 9 mitochondrial [Onygenales sp. PD_12]
MAKPTQLPSALAMSNFFRSIFAPQLPTPSASGINSLATSCRRCLNNRSSTQIWQPSNRRYSSRSHPSLTASSETPELEPDVSAISQLPESKTKGDIRPQDSASRKMRARDTKRSAKPPQESALPFRKVETNKPGKLDGWMIQKRVLKEKYKDGWNPKKRVPPETLDIIRHLHQQDPLKYSNAVLAEEYKVSPEAIRRILKSKWQPSEKEAVERKERWEKRNQKIWNQMAEIGLRPQRKAFRQD